MEIEENEIIKLLKNEAGDNEDEIISSIEKLDEGEVKKIIDETNGDSILMVSLDKKKFKVSRWLIEDKGWLIDEGNKKKLTPLIRSCARGHEDIVNLLLQRRCNLNCQDLANWTPLHFSLDKDQLQIASKLIDSGCDLNLQISVGWTALYKALHKGQLEIATKIIQKGCDLNLKDNTGWSALFKSLDAGHLEIATLLINSEGCDLNIQDKGEMTSLMWAIQKGHLDIAALLISKGCDLNLRDKKGRTALMCSLEKGYVEFAYKLIESGCDIFLRTNDGENCLHFACKNIGENKAPVRSNRSTSTLHQKHSMLSFASIKEAYPSSSKPSILCDNCKAKITMGYHCFFYSCGFDLCNDCMSSTLSSEPPFLSTSTYLEKNTNLIKEMLKRSDGDVSVDKNAKSKSSLTKVPKEETKGTQVCESCKMHFHNSDVIYCDIKGKHIYGDGSKYRMHLNCLVAAIDAFGSTPLHVCHSKQALNALLDKGVSIERKNKEGNTPLHCAVMNNNVGVVKLLIEKGANWKALNKFKRTPLMMANSDATLELLMTLIEIDLPFAANENGKELIFNSNHFYSLNKMLDVALDVNLSRVSLIENLIKVKFPNIPRLSIIKAMAYLKDENDREIFDIGNKELKSFFNGELLFCSRYKLNEGPPIHKSETSVVMLAKDYGFYENLFIKFSTLVDVNETKDLDDDDLLCMDVSQFIEVIKNLNSLALEHETRISFDVILKNSPQIKLVEKGLINKNSFVDYCCRIYGFSQPVVLKFMKNQDQYQREIDIRQQNNLDSKHVLGLLDGPSQDLFNASISSLHHDFVENLSDYKFAVFFPAADRSLDQIYRQERPTSNVIKDIMLKLALGVKECHNKGVIHGDIKLLNGIRVGSNILVIDMDASAKLNVDKIGAKFSSAVLPPELFTVLKDDKACKMYEEYWKDDKVNNTDLWKKVKPVSVQHGMKKIKIVVKSFKTTNIEKDNKGFIQVLNEDKLPYKLVIANEKFDVWSFGVTLFTMLSGSSLIPSNRDDDIDGASNLLKFVNWTDSDILNEIKNKIQDDLAQDLLSKILKKDSNKRVGFLDILSHPYFTGEKDVAILNVLNSVKEDLVKQNKELAKQNDLLEMIDKRTEKILKLNEETFLQLAKTERVLLRGMFEATEVSVPSCFIILNQKIENEKSDSKVESFDAVARADEKLSMAVDWIDKLSDLGSSISAAISSGDPSDLVSSAIGKLTEGEKLYFYLVDEYTMKPVVLDDDSTYPIEISSPALFVPKILPLMKIGLKAMTLVNGISNIGQCFGLPIPSIPSDIVNKVNGAVGAINQDSSVAEFDILQSKVNKQRVKSKSEESNEDSPENVRGLALRELQQFYLQNDNKNGFSGLRRVFTNEGLTCWTLPENVESIKCGKDPPSAKTNRPVSPRKLYNDSLAAKDLEIKNLKEENEKLKKS